MLSGREAPGIRSTFGPTLRRACLSAAQLALLRANVTKARRLVCYDGSGVAAAKLASAMVREAGHQLVANPA